ncbi:hemerythrin domain-containing protein [Anaeromicropila herbilytica]|uniref:Cation-binding protein n=1 Tax=Anaeromicropila herbilytica TaxID=2785025 RepID=A0A7R7EMX6_9FIRM|nr:hemerythrin domain-containing protein [Anaeromicropila herbilytica]BCN31811.1 cation-binding protein [Anaeromicropila herbilytica]
MIVLDNFDRQHGVITEEVSIIEKEVKKDSSLINASEVALHISRLSGHLKMHLLEEDKFLYPSLLNNNDKQIQTLAKEYMDEMGDLANEYNEYKSNYNVASKILKDLDSFVNDTTKILKALKLRLSKEDHGLYQLIKDKSL